MESDLVAVLRRSGWSADRRAAPDWLSAVYATMEREGFAVVDALRDVLGSYGGLKLGSRGTGVSQAREVVDVDPRLCVGEVDRFEWVGECLGRTLSPVGELGGGHAFVGIDEDGAIYIFDLEVWRAGLDWDSALHKLLLGHRTEIWGGNGWTDDW